MYNVTDAVVVWLCNSVSTEIYGSKALKFATYNYS